MSTTLVQKRPADPEQRVGKLSTDPLCSRICESAAKNPQRPAVVYGGQALSWADLNAQSDRVAARLSTMGFGRDCCIALLLERSPRFIVAALAVLKTGAAYLPLDVATPLDRLEQILADSSAEFLITEGDLIERLATHNPQAGTRDASSTCEAMNFAELLASSDAERAPASGRDLRADAPCPGAAADDGASLDSLAYVIYTSGSTGRPKGVEITRGNLLNLIDWHCRAFDVTAADRASQVARLGFDAAAWEIWPSLAAGATLHLADDQACRSPTSFRDFLLAEKITIAFAPTLMAEQLLSMNWPKDTALRTLLTGADTLHRRPPTGLPFTLVNNYGPTECTVVATSGVIVAGEDNQRPSIGRPIDNTVVAILDEDQRPVSPGEAGELCLAGALVGRGYRNDPELTAARFVHCPVAPEETLSDSIARATARDCCRTEK